METYIIPLILLLLALLPVILREIIKIPKLQKAVINIIYSLAGELAVLLLMSYRFAQKSDAGSFAAGETMILAFNIAVFGIICTIFSVSYILRYKNQLPVIAIIISVMISNPVVSGKLAVKISPVLVPLAGSRNERINKKYPVSRRIREAQGVDRYPDAIKIDEVKMYANIKKAQQDFMEAETDAERIEMLEQPEKHYFVNGQHHYDIESGFIGSIYKNIELHEPERTDLRKAIEKWALERHPQDIIFGEGWSRNMNITEYLEHKKIRDEKPSAKIFLKTVIDKADKEIMELKGSYEYLTLWDSSPLPANKVSQGKRFTDDRTFYYSNTLNRYNNCWMSVSVSLLNANIKEPYYQGNTKLRYYPIPEKDIEILLQLYVSRKDIEFVEKIETIIDNAIIAALKEETK